MVWAEKRFASVLGHRMAYVEAGDPEGRPIVFLHGNPTSSFLWRGVMPHLTGLGRCLAPDLIGMGDSDKLPDSGPDRYTFVEHRRFLDALFDQLGVAGAVFVVHDWGSALGFDWSRRHPGAVAGIAYMEAIVRPVTWADWPEAGRKIFQAMRSPAGEELVLEKNVFVDRILPNSVLRPLPAEVMEEYRRPFAQPGEDRRPTLTWPRQIPFVSGDLPGPGVGEPPDVIALVEEYGAWLEQSHHVPKLFVNAEPGSILVGAAREYCRRWPNQTEVVVAGRHFVQEDSADAIGDAVAAWMAASVAAG